MCTYIASARHALCWPNKRGQRLRERGYSSRNLWARLFAQQTTARQKKEARRLRRSHSKMSSQDKIDEAMLILIFKGLVWNLQCKSCKFGCYGACISPYYPCVQNGGLDVNIVPNLRGEHSGSFECQIRYQQDVFSTMVYKLDVWILIPQIEHNVYIQPRYSPSQKRFTRFPSVDSHIISSHPT